MLGLTYSKKIKSSSNNSYFAYSFVLPFHRTNWAQRMDKSLAKGLTKRFFRELIPNTHAEINRALHFSQRKRKRKNAYVEVKSLFLGELSDFLVESVVIGPPKKESLCFTSFSPEEEDLIERWDEPNLRPHFVVLSGSRGHYIEEAEVLSWEASHHAVQRIIQRNQHIDSDNFHELMRLVTKEFRYVNICAHILHSFWMICCLAPTLDQNLEEAPISREMIKDGIALANPEIFSVTVPATWGIFRCKFSYSKERELSNLGPLLTIRTYIPRELLSQAEQEDWEVLTGLLKPAINTHLPYAKTEAMLSLNDESYAEILSLGFLCKLSTQFWRLFRVESTINKKEQLDKIKAIPEEYGDLLEDFLDLVKEVGWNSAILLINKSKNEA